MIAAAGAAGHPRPPRPQARPPLYAGRRTLHTDAHLLSDEQKYRLTPPFIIDDHVEVEVTWGIYQRTIAAYREPDRKQGRP